MMVDFNYFYPMTRRILFFFFFTLLFYSSIAQIKEKPTPVPNNSGTKTKSASAPIATVEITWTGSSAAKVQIGTKEISVASGMPVKMDLPPNEGLKIKVNTGEISYEYSEFVVFR